MTVPKEGLIGLALAPHQALVEAGPLRLFAKATGETNPVYTDASAAREAGHPGLPVPPSYLSCLHSTRTDHGAWREKAGFQRERVLHGEQSFAYERMAYVGDVLQFDTRVSDYYEKKNGALQFLVLESRVINQRGEHVATMRSTIVHRN
jgi:acyl dehydratase